MSGLANNFESERGLSGALRRLGRSLLHSTRVFDFGAWLYDLMTANEVWRESCGRLLDGIPATSGRLKILDLGIGPGVSAFAMGRRRREADFIGLDIAQNMVEIAARNRVARGWPPDRLSLLRGDALHLPLDDDTLDVVSGHSFLYLLPDYTVGLSEAYRALRAGGYVAFLEPHAGGVSWTWLLNQADLRLLVSVSLWRFYSWLHRRFSTEMMTVALHQTGFTDVTTEVTLGGFGIFGRARKP